MDDKIGYRSANDVVSGVVLVFLITFIIFNTEKKEYRIISKHEKKQSTITRLTNSDKEETQPKVVLS